jgi:hypothetical protein
MTFKGFYNDEQGGFRPQGPPSVSKRGFIYKRKGDIYRLIFKVSAMPGQLSALDRKRSDRSHSCMNFCI